MQPLSRIAVTLQANLRPAIKFLAERFNFGLELEKRRLRVGSRQAIIDPNDGLIGRESQFTAQRGLGFELATVLQRCGHDAAQSLLIRAVKLMLLIEKQAAPVFALINADV